MALNSIYKATLFSHYGPTPCVNVYHFKQVAAGGIIRGSAELVSAIDSSYFPALLNIANVAIAYDRMTVENIGDPTDFASGSLAGNAGAVTGDGLPPQSAFTFLYGRATRLYRNGYKRYCGVSESTQNGGVASGAIIPFLNALATVLQSPISNGLNTFNPGLLHTMENGLPVPPVFYNISSVQYAHIGTQNTRRI